MHRTARGALPDRTPDLLLAERGVVLGLLTVGVAVSGRSVLVSVDRVADVS